MEPQQANDLLQEAERLTVHTRAARQWARLPPVVFGGLSLLASAPVQRGNRSVGADGLLAGGRPHRLHGLRPLPPPPAAERTGVGGAPVGPYVATGVILLLCLLVVLPFHLEFLAIAVALLLLARRERSRSLAVIAVVGSALSLVAGLYNTENLYGYSGAFADSIEVMVLGVFLPGAGVVLRARSGEAGAPSHR